MGARRDQESQAAIDLEAQEKLFPGSREFARRYMKRQGQEGTFIEYTQVKALQDFMMPFIQEAYWEGYNE